MRRRRQAVCVLRFAFRVSPHSVGILWSYIFFAFCARPAEIDLSKLPPAVTNRIDYLRDIKPILDASCFKCHGPEKPKSRFRLDNRESLLRGGDNGQAVISGDSAHSPLIHYVARLVDDMEMPPKGKGEPLTQQQIALLRAWIDQNLPWTEGEAVRRSDFAVSPTFGWMNVNGDKRKFRENEWIREGWNGGLERFLLKESMGRNARAIVEGRALRDDYKVTLTVEKTDVGFVRAGFQQYRKYFDDSGGYYAPFAPSLFSLGRDLHLDLGKAWVEAGTTAPFGTQVLLGYEYQYKDGMKSLTQWLPVTRPSDNRTKNILPTAKEIDERLHIMRADLSHEWTRVQLQDSFRYEFYDLHTTHSSVVDASPTTDVIQRIKEGNDLQNLVNSFQIAFQPKEWLQLSAGYLYTHVDGETGFRQTPLDLAGLPTGGVLWNGQGIMLEQSAHVFNANAQFIPWEHLTFSAGLQTEWNRQKSFGTVNLDETDFVDRSRERSDIDRFVSEEKVTMRFTRIPFTVIFADFGFRQERATRFDVQDSESGVPFYDFRRQTDSDFFWQQYRAGFNVSPWTRVAFNAYYLHRVRDHDYDTNNTNNTSATAYPAFIRGRKVVSDEAGARLTVRPTAWIKTTLSYKRIGSDYKTSTDSTFVGPDSTPGGSIKAADYDAQIYSFNATVNPWRRLYLLTTFSFEESRSVATDNGSAAIVPFRGKIYSVINAATYVLNDKTDLSVSYDFSHGDYSQNNEESGLPLGIDYERHGLRVGMARQFWKRFTTRLEYAWYHYDEPSGGRFNDYTAHGVFATLFMRWQ
jgi:hypothetical protein